MKMGNIIIHQYFDMILFIFIMYECVSTIFKTALILFGRIVMSFS